jgi:hypothetical protein
MDYEAANSAGPRFFDGPGSGVKCLPSSRPKPLLHHISTCTLEGANDTGKQPIPESDGTRALRVASTRTRCPVLADVS